MKQSKEKQKKITCTLCDGEGYVSSCCAWTMKLDKKNKLRCDKCGYFTKKVKCILCDGNGKIDK